MQKNRRLWGRKGRGKEVLPVSEFKEGKMTRISKRIGYDTPTSIPDAKLPKFTKELADEYGPTTAKRMVIPQITLRHTTHDPQRIANKRKFIKMRDLLNRQYPVKCNCGYVTKLKKIKGRKTVIKCGRCGKKMR